MAEMQMVRPSAGVGGKKIKVTVNAYKVGLPSMLIHHYDVAVEGLVSKHGTVGDVPPALGKELFAALKAMKAFEAIPVVYDGRKTMFSPKLLNFPDNKQTFDVNLATPSERAAKRNRSFKVVLTKVGEVKLDNLLKYVKKQVGATPDEGVYIAITALNVLCNHDMMMSHTTSKNKFFPRPAPPPEGQVATEQVLRLKTGIEMWRGYFSSIRMAPGGVIMNFDLTSQPMLKHGNLVDICCAILGRVQPPALKNLPPAKFTQLSRALKSMRVTVARIDKTLLKSKIKDVAPSARAMIFEAPVSPNSTVMKKWNVAEYIEFTYNMKLRGADLPVVKLTAKGWYPLEICNVEPGQKYNKKLNPEELSEAIRWLTVKPTDRTKMLTDGIRAYVKPAPTLGSWGVRMDANPMVIPARRLPAPTLTYQGVGPAGQVKVDSGAWNMQSKKLLKPVAVTSWVAVVLGQPKRDISPQQAARALEGLQQAAHAMGLPLSGQQGPTIFPTNRDNLSPAVEGSVGAWIMSKVKSKPQLIICFLRDKTAWEYRQIKVFGDSTQGIATQCFAVDKVTTKGNAQYFANVVLKINAKLGGTNHAVGMNGNRLFATRTMVLGADVTHPGGDSLEPSIAAVVGSTNEHGGGYGAEFSVQPGRQEIISDLHHMVKELLIKFAQRNHALPDKLIFYRDGVSEGQFPDVVAKEIPLVRQAMRAVGENAKYTTQAAAMKLTYVICGKRHHFKFGAIDTGDRDKSGNLHAGTMIDTDVVHPFDFDWYGLSHSGLLGTSRAAHYTVLVDDAKFKPDDIQQLTYNLCYTYARATRSVSIATPAYYAHHVCTRIKAMLSAVQINQSSLSPTDTDLDNALRDYRTKANEIRTAFRASYNKAGNFPVLEYWM
ncbi:hypothetical protein MJO28_012811 [Puccinia striiformis f. sp. tritici]|uniref:Piwi domain-containing protein n=3 Tax=Puccinia striiformis f. sp. tritici TaxID=168172 RepID=A0A0L0VM91_9BASI|nr:argonaute-like protein [Puccinia striiformis f. sp. tritici]KNF00397.1 hypothetical protein PSTG_06326 [Puccinia striiformis f. sp. tritici PST-78]KAH9445098.1 hypothetical protein Pst134EB_025348 [Puccinia striiformis f. sp. tritici]KAI7940526.1 hypothetical protein MJO28_012811 [Puccinia striiformis f. sp. tritici]KAI7943411.1 hypothetical protein MJO29_013255 [Puccinia striiformis f. sp. tritici]